jgi:hypothetical protein
MGLCFSSRPLLEANGKIGQYRDEWHTSLLGSCGDSCICMFGEEGGRGKGKERERENVKGVDVTPHTNTPNTHARQAAWPEHFCLASQLSG